ncbi:MAG: general secretion pathway protein GspK [Deltaproteobacteria bacterium]|nr:general secretion pathway protein GspK [Deltaproteobacteria bacterium]
MALILVVFVVALASILVLNLAYSTFMGSRVSVMVEHSMQAEYLLKSAVNFARVLIKEDTSPEDAYQDLWGKFSGGSPIPLDLLGIKQPNMQIELEIRPEESKVPLRAMVPIAGGEPDLKWRGVMTRLFRNLGFDDDQEEDQTGLFPGRHFSSEELVANLIDYMDQDKESYNPGDFASGIESDLPPDTFPNSRINRVGEIKVIPGFTPARIRKLEPLVTVFGNSRINVNLAPAVVIKSLSDDISDAEVEAMLAFRKSDDGPFTFENQKEKLGEMIGEPQYDKINTMISVESRWFQVLSKVDYGTSTYFMRAFLSKQGNGELPQIRSVELF